MCIPLHKLKRSCHLCPRWVNVGNKTTPSMHHQWRWNMLTSMVGLKKMVTYAKISPKITNPRDIARKAEKEEERPQQQDSLKTWYAVPYPSKITVPKNLSCSSMHPQWLQINLIYELSTLVCSFAEPRKCRGASGRHTAERVRQRQQIEMIEKMNSAPNSNFVPVAPNS